MTMYKNKKMRFDLDVTAADSSVSKIFELDKDITAIKGMLITSDRDDLLYYRGSQRIEINKDEFFPADYESKLLMSGISVAPKQRYYDLGNVHPGNYNIKVDYKDRTHSLTTFVPYRVSYYFDCETE
jgi:hypothetical protein